MWDILITLIRGFFLLIFLIPTILHYGKMANLDTEPIFKVIRWGSLVMAVWIAFGFPEKEKHSSGKFDPRVITSSGRPNTPHEGLFRKVDEQIRAERAAAKAARNAPPDAGEEHFFPFRMTTDGGVEH